MKRKMPLSGTLNIDSFYNNGAADAGVTYEVPTNQQHIIEINASGVVTPKQLGTASVNVKAGGVVIGNVTISVVSAEEWALVEDPQVLITNSQTLDFGPVLITKNDKSWTPEQVVIPGFGTINTYSNDTGNGKQYIYKTNSSNMNAGNELSYLIDGDQSTVWSIGGASQYGANAAFALFFEKVRKPSRVEIDFASGCTGDWLIRIYGYDSSYNTVSVAGQAHQLFSVQKVLSEGKMVFNLPVYMDFRRLQFEFGGFGGNINIKELRVYEESTAPTTRPLISPNSSSDKWIVNNQKSASVVESGLTYNTVLDNNYLVQYGNSVVDLFDGNPSTYLTVARAYGYFWGGVGSAITILPTAKRPERFEIDVLEVGNTANQRNILGDSWAIALYGVLETDSAANNLDNSGTWKFLGSMDRGVLEGKSSIEMSYGLLVNADNLNGLFIQDGLYKKLKVNFMPISQYGSGYIKVSAIRWY